MTQTVQPISPRLLRLSPLDNVATITATTEKGVELELDQQTKLVLLNKISVGHKVAVRDITLGEKVVKFGCPIGSATRAIAAGEHVHTHNLKSDYIPTFTLDEGGKFIKG